MKSVDPVKSVYVPPYGLQGQEFSSHILWDTDYTLLSISIKLEEGIEFSSVYNAPAEKMSLESNGQSLRVNEVTENGYLGFVLKSHRLSSASKSLVIRIVISLNKDQETSEVARAFTLKLFRPDLKIVSVPELIKAISDKNHPFPSTEPKIKLANSGPGIAYLLVVPGKSSSVHFKNLFHESSKTFIANIKTAFNNLKIDYPQEEKFLDVIAELLTRARKVEEGDPSALSGMDDLLSSFVRSKERIERTNPALMDDMSQSISDIFYSVFSANKEFQSWVQALEGMRAQRILLLNPVSAIVAPKGDSSLDLSLFYFDASGAPFDPLEAEGMTLRVTALDEVLIPVFELISSESE